jgi:ParB-like chromosome segregation protein Spo0J
MTNPIWKGAPALKPLLVPLSDLRPDPKNAREHGERSFEAIRKSYERFGQLKPVVVGGGVVVAGNGTLEAVRRMGWTHLAVVDAAGLSPDELKAFALADNRTAELSGAPRG